MVEESNSARGTSKPAGVALWDGVLAMSRDGLLPYKHRVVAHYAFILFVNLLDSNYRRRRHASAAPVLLLLFHSTLTHKTPDPDGTISIDKTIVAYMYVCMYVCVYVCHCIHHDCNTQ
jgi:hypothetical protein